ncbi:MAG: YihA family ribosome biogenesis GTP-binding protein [Rikenellaceae bacterium]|nr:YihA family ribosome biogenesis GTP-binding protein [Rikenellaceae bacterium]
MHIHSAIFQCSSQKIGQCPEGTLPEFAFIGRSNVGKSSLVNMLTDKPGLAKVSGKPGKTRLINHFLIDGRWYLVDLPGYGYARVSKNAREEFSKLITDYVLKREQMCLLFVLVDSRLEPQRIDIDFINMLGENGVPFGIVFTKCDKQGVNQTASNIARYKRKLHETWETLPPIFATSSEKREGRDQILSFIERCLSECE